MKSEAPTTIEDAYTYVAECWQRIEAHIREVFFGNDLAQSFILNATHNGLYELIEAEFADQSVFRLSFHPWNASDVHRLLIGIIKDDRGTS